MPRPFPWVAGLVLVGSVVQAQAPSASEEHGALLAEIRELQRHVVWLEASARRQEEWAGSMRQQLIEADEQLKSLRERVVMPTALPFLSGPPPSTDAVGVARVAVFAPRVAVDSARAHDVVLLRLRRVEPTVIRTVAQLELGRDELATDLPLDQNGALYIVDWSTAEGYTYTLHLRDGSGGPDAGGPPAGTAQVKPQQSQGRFVFVGYRVD